MSNKNASKRSDKIINKNSKQCKLFIVAGLLDLPLQILIFDN